MPLQWDLAYKRKTSLDWLNLSSQSWVWFWIFFSGIYSPDEKCRRKYHIFTTLRLEIFIMVSNGTIKNWVSKCQYNEWPTVTLTLSVCETETDSVSQWLTDWVVSECDFELQLVTLSLTSYSSLLTCDCECVTHTHLVSDSQCHYSLFTKSNRVSQKPLLSDSHSLAVTAQWVSEWESDHSGSDSDNDNHWLAYLSSECDCEEYRYSISMNCSTSSFVFVNLLLLSVVCCSFNVS